MLQRGPVFHQFTERYPEARESTRNHVTGRQTDVRVGMYQNIVENVFVGVYEEDGSTANEYLLEEDTIMSSLGTANPSASQARELGRQDSTRFAGDID